MKKIIVTTITCFAFLVSMAQSNENYINSKAIENSKFYSHLTFGVLPAQEFSSSFHVVNGYNLNQKWQFGVGLGIENFANRGYLPIFGEGRYNFMSSLSTPFISVMAGYDFALRNTEFNKGGFTTGLKIGLDHYFSDHVGLSTSVGYRYAYLKIDNAWWEDFSTIREINRLEFRFGIIFK